MKLLTACVSVFAVFAAVVGVTLAVRAAVPLLAERWRWVERAGDWLWERRGQR